MLSRKVLSLTKPKGKIYKTKSLSHYIILKSELICLHTSIAIVYTQLNGFTYNTNNSILYYSFVCTQWSGPNIVLTNMHTVNWFQTLLFSTNNFIQPDSFICPQLNGFKSCSVLLIILFLHKVKELQVLLFNTNNFIQHYSYICKQ